MLPDVEAYNAAVTKADEDYQTALDAVASKHREAGTMYEGVYYDEADSLIKPRNDAKDAAWEALKESADPFVAWVATNCKDYQYEAIIVLQHAPFTDADALEELRSQHGWCGAWTSLHEQAEAAGVIPGSVPLSPEREALVAELSRTFGVSRHRAKKLMGLLDAVYLADTKPIE